jgi:hypothetical protein
MADDEQLFYESWRDATRDLIRAAGGSKAVAAKLWPHKPPDEAQRLLADCLNPDRPVRFDPDRLLMLLRIGHEAGHHGLMRHLAREGGYTDPSPIKPTDEAAELQRKFITAAAALHSMADRIERLTKTPLQAVKTA